MRLSFKRNHVTATENMEDYNSHGIDYIEAYITRKEIPPTKYLELAQLEVQRISKLPEISYERSLQYLVRSMINCCHGIFKKEVRLWMLKLYQSKKPRLELSEYERELALKVHGCKDSISTGELMKNSREIRHYGQYRIEDQPVTPTPQTESIIPQCPTHKKDCRLWLHKTTDPQRRTAVTDKICQWYRDNMDLPSRLSTSPRVRASAGDGGVGDSDFQVAVSRTKDERCQYNRMELRHKVRHVSFQNDCHSNSSSDSEGHLPGRQTSPRSQVYRADNYSTKSHCFYSPDSDPEMETQPQPPLKMSRKGQENENANASKTVSDVKDAGPTPSNSSVCTQISAQYEKIAEADEVLARQMLEAEVGGRPLSQCELITRTQTYLPVYRSQSWESGEEHLDIQPGACIVEPLGECNFNSNLRRRNSSLCSLNGCGSD